MLGALLWPRVGIVTLQASQHRWTSSTTCNRRCNTLSHVCEHSAASACSGGACQRPKPGSVASAQPHRSSAGSGGHLTDPAEDLVACSMECKATEPKQNPAHRRGACLPGGTQSPARLGSYPSLQLQSSHGRAAWRRCVRRAWSSRKICAAQCVLASSRPAPSSAKRALTWPS